MRRCMNGERWGRGGWRREKVILVEVYRGRFSILDFKSVAVGRVGGVAAGEG